MMSETAITAIVVAVLGSGGLWAFIQWAIERRRQSVRRDELAGIMERALADSPTIRDIESKLDRDWEHFERDGRRLDAQDEQLSAIRLIVLRQCLFSRPHDRTAHESALEYGAEYVRLGGNGPGHIRYEQLSEDYRRRLKSNDWDYTERRP